MTYRLTLSEPERKCLIATIEHEIDMLEFAYFEDWMDVDVMRHAYDRAVLLRVLKGLSE